MGPIVAYTVWRVLLLLVRMIALCGNLDAIMILNPQYLALAKGV